MAHPSLAQVEFYSDSRDAMKRLAARGVSQPTYEDLTNEIKTVEEDDSTKKEIAELKVRVAQLERERHER